MSVYIVDVAQVNVSSWYYLPLYFQAVRGASPVRSGVLLMPMVVVQALVGVAVGGIIFRYGWIRPILWTGMALSTVGFGLFVTLGPTTSLPNLVAIEIVAAMGIGAVFQAPLIAYQAAVDAADMAIATAVIASITFAHALDKRGTVATKPRAAALAALEVVIEHLRTVEPSEDTRVLGLGW